MTRIAFERVLAIRSGRVSGWLAAALVAHAGLAFVLARNANAAPPAPPPPIEVDLAEEPQPPPPKLAEPPPPVEHDAPSAAAPIAKPLATAAPAPAGAILAAKDDAPTPKGEEPVSFVTDPNGSEYGSGVVAKGGTASVGLPGAALPAATATLAAPVVAPPPKPSVEAPVANLSRKPSLDVPDACKGYFPSSAEDDHALVTLRVIVRATGSVQSANVVAENPKGQGFGAAARTCLLARTFTPGLDEAGNPAMAQTTVNVRFSR